MRRFLRFLLLFPIASSGTALSAGASAQGRIDCNVLNSRILKQAVHYCVELPPGYDANDTKLLLRRYPVLYLLHGLGENEQTLFSTGGWNLIEDLRQQHKIGDFLIVAPEGKRSFYINSADGSVRYSDFFLTEFMPYIENKYRIRSGRQARAITGISMGGYGALRFAFAHPELFSSVSAQSAALITVSPQELSAAERSGTSLGSLLVAVFGQPIDAPHWQENSPFVLARKDKAGLRRLPIYFNCGQEDDFGFERGAEALHQELQTEGVQHEYHSYPGDHSLTYFLTHLGETLEFHSRVFAAWKQFQK
jgi:S-formylglutathione hydrolase FrmB